MGGPSGEAAAQVTEGWRHLAMFFREGARHLPPAVAAFRDAERAQRAAGGGEDLVNTLLGLSLALRLTRDPDEGRRAVVLAQELGNIMRRSRGDAGALPYRSSLEAAYRDLADVEQNGAAAAAAEEGIAACDRTLALARRLRLPGAVPASRATKAALVHRRGALGRPAEAARGRRDALRLFAAALDAWPARDVEGRAAVLCDYSEAVAEGRDPPRAERLAADAADALGATPNRYLSARALRAQARAALAADRADALDLLAAAAAEFRALGCEWDARQVEGLV